MASILIHKHIFREIYLKQCVHKCQPLSWIFVSVTLNHSEDVLDPILLAYDMTLVSSFAWTILFLSPPESTVTEFGDCGWLGICVLASNHPADVKSTGQLFCMLNCGAGRASFSLTIFSPYSLKEVFVLDSLISQLIYFSSRNAVLEF